MSAALQLLQDAAWPPPVYPLLKRTQVISDRAFRRLRRMMDQAEPRLRQSFLRAVVATQNGSIKSEVRRAIEDGRLDDAVVAIPWQEIGGKELRQSFLPEFRNVYDSSGAIATQMTSSSVAGSWAYDIINPRASQFIESHGADLVREIGDETRLVLREILRVMQDRGLPTREAARMLQSHIGLTERFSRAVENYRARLVADGMGLGKAGDKAERYAARLLRHRANNIARTEAQYAATAGQQESWQQAVDEGAIDPMAAVMVWLTAQDELVCPQCGPLDGQTAPLGGSFDGVSGPPAHPSCRCSLYLRARED